MPTETVTEIDRRLVFQRIKQLGQQAQVVANLKEIAQRVLDSGKDSMVGLSLDRQSFWAGQVLERRQKEACVYPGKHRELLRQSGLADVILSPELKLPEVEAIPTIPVDKHEKAKRGNSRLERVDRASELFDELIDGVRVVVKAPTQIAVLRAALQARDSDSAIISNVFVRMVISEEKEPDARKAASLVGAYIQFLNQTLAKLDSGLQVKNAIPKDRSYHEKARYYLAGREGFVPSPPTDGHQPDMLPLLPSMGVLDLSGDGAVPFTREDFETGPLTFSEADRLVLGLALLKNYDNYKDLKTGRLTKFGLNLSAQKAGEIRLIVGKEEVDHNFVPGPVFNRIIQLITHIISNPQMLRRQNPPEMEVIFDLFRGYNQKPSSVQDLDKNLRDLLGSWMQLRRVSR